MKKGIDYIGVGIGAVIVNKDRKIFLSQRGRNARNEKGRWECPGGGLEFGDTFENTIIREIKEEFGIDIKIVDSLEPFNHLIPEEKQHWVALCFVCKVVKGEPKILEPNKCQAIGWFTLKEMGNMDLTIASRYRLKQIKEKYLKGPPNFY